MDKLRTAIRLVLALNDAPVDESTYFEHGWVVRLDPQAEQQLRDALDEDPEETLVPQLRRLQYAANSLNVNEFCTAMGWPRNEYSEHKFKEFQALGRLGVFDNATLAAPVAFYEARERRFAAERKRIEEQRPCQAHADCVVTGDHDAHYTASYVSSQQALAVLIEDECDADD